MNCKDKGYKVGQVFRDKRDGALFVLTEDDGTGYPFFYSLACEGGHTTIPLNKLVRVYPPEEKISITIEGKTTEISRESADALKKMLNGMEL